jgi:hypothetical protein
MKYASIQSERVVGLNLGSLADLSLYLSASVKVKKAASDNPIPPTLSR